MITRRKYMAANLTTILRHCVALTIALSAMVTNLARADVVAARGQKPLVSTQVLRLENGRLFCRGEGGTEISYAIEQVDYLQITGWQMLNLAEKQRRAADWRRAAVSYEKALADLQADSNGDALDRKLLVQCRLIPVWDTQARFERAVELYLEVVERMPVLIDAMRPTKFPETGSAVLEMAGRLVDSAIERHGNDPIGESLVKWKATWPVRPSASMPADGGVPPIQPVDRFAAEQVAAVAELVRNGRNAEALERIGSLHTQLQGNWRGDLYYWQGRALEAVAASALPSVRTRPTDAPSANSGADALTQAGIAYMRVVVHFPRHALAAESLYRAAEVCRRTGQADQAAALWSELIAVYPRARSADGAFLADKAREELK